MSTPQNYVETWILTFNRPVVLNRLIRNLNAEGIKPWVFSNHPDVHIEKDLSCSGVVINTLNCEQSSSWCARSWNSIFLKSFAEHNAYGAVCIQDDTNIRPGFARCLIEEAEKYDFISAPAGDQFFYITLPVLKKVGWFDERYLGCYCGDADYFKRVYMKYDKARVSNYDTHSWGWMHNPSQITMYLDTEYQTKMCEPNYQNQHWALDAITKVNKTLQHSQSHYENKWGVELDNNGPAISKGTYSHIEEIDWYPWASNKLGFTCT
jgi:hypothetical protein